ncbi:MAG: tail fiber protein [Bacteroidota bacterium]
MIKYSFTKILTSSIALFLLLSAHNLTAQTNPISEKGFSYQGYARDFEGNAIGTATVFVRFSIYEEGQSNNPDFTELHDLTTDAFGVFSSVVGSENTAQFFGLDWANKNYFLRAEVSVNNTDFVVVSETQLLSVPYAQAAGRAQNGVPAGSITAFAGAGDNLPEGYVLCDGRELNVADFPELFAAIGDSWGGNGISTFRVPDLRGQFLRGVSGNSDTDPDKSDRVSVNGSNSGNAVGSFQGDEIESHNHDMETAGAHSHNLRFGNSTSGNGRAHESSTANNGSYQTESAGAHTHTINNRGGSETRPVNAYVNYIIKI